MGRDPAKGRLLFMDHLLHATLDTHIVMLQREMDKNMGLGARLRVEIWGLVFNCWSCRHCEIFLPPLDFIQTMEIMIIASYKLYFDD